MPDVLDRGRQLVPRLAGQRDPDVDARRASVFRDQPLGKQGFGERDVPCPGPPPQP